MQTEPGITNEKIEEISSGIMNISFAPSVCIHRSIVLTFIEKKYACRFFSHGTYFIP